MKRSSTLRRTPLARISRELQARRKDANREFLDGVERAIFAPPLRRTPLAKRGARSKREADALAEFRSVVLQRAGDRCERCGVDGIRHRIEAHHIVNRARAAGWPMLHDPRLNGLAVCATTCHPRLTVDPMDAGRRFKVQVRISIAFAFFEAWRAGGGT